jgi:peptidyl-prolyl cis-trans isomerase B (cyclophilin B)
LSRTASSPAGLAASANSLGFSVNSVASRAGPLRFLVAGLIVALVLACGGGSGDNGASAGTTQTGSCTPAGSRIAAIPRSQQRSFPTPPERVIDTAKTYIATLRTDRGEITLQLDAANAPNTVNNFVFLACNGFYDGLTFHRVVKEPTPFVIQGGDPRGDGTGGPGYIFADEFSPSLKHDTGVISMANSGPNTNGSQFFITLAPAPHLNGRHSVFGKVTSGMNTVNAIRQGDKVLGVSVEER